MIDAVVISINEPQLDRCLQAINDQTVKFNNVTHINGIVPESESFKVGMKTVCGDWFMKIDGDMILNKNAVQTAINYTMQNFEPQVCGYYFGLYDTFMEVNMGFCGVLKTKAYQSVADRRRDRLSEEIETINLLRKDGWIIKKFQNPWVIIGSHFDNPDEFQVFRRFYCAGVRENNNSFAINQLTKYKEKTNNPLYSLALKAIAFAKSKNRQYIGSRNIDFDKKLFEEFKELNENMSC